MKRNDYASQILTLSLFLVIMVFFIALNNSSDFKSEKVTPVLASLESAFASKIFGKKKNYLKQQTNTQSLFSSNEFDELSIALKNALSARNVIANDESNTLIMIFQKEVFIQSLAKKQSLGFMNFEDKLLDLLNNAQTPYMMDIQLYVEDLNNFDIEDDIARIKQSFAQVKVTSDQFKISVKQGDPNDLVMTLRPKSMDLMHQIIQSEP